MTADEDLLLLANFLFNRFRGVRRPSEAALKAAIQDWREEAYSWPPDDGDVS